jgi:iron complex outermembrane recepter protein
MSLCHWCLGCALLGSALIGVAAAADSDSLEEVVVTATLRDTRAVDLPSSVTVLSSADLHAGGEQQLQDVLMLVPDLNWAAGTERPRYFQLRGIGEVEQYQGAPNPSVGFLIDDIDFSGVGGVATLFDIDQVEVLRGPQGTSYGANALAGLISVHSHDPGDQFELHGEAGGATYGTGSAGLAVGDGTQDFGWRIAAQQYQSDGFRDDVYLHQDSTNGYDEGTLRGKLRWQITPGLRADLTLMYVDLNDGYDAWSVYNTYNTYSNEPGRDAQRSRGVALRLTDDAVGFGEIRSVTSAADSAINYSYDGDWGNDTLWAPYAPNDFFQSDLRGRHTQAEDLRFIGDEAHELFGGMRWLVGAYALHMSESDLLHTSYDYLPNPFDNSVSVSGSDVLQSEYSATNVALYGSLDEKFGERSQLSMGLRVEQRTANYRDDADAPFPKALDRMIGGNLSWSHLIGDSEHFYATLARGYKAGGFNIGTSIAADERRFQPEYLWNLETGIKQESASRTLQWQADVFYMRRQDEQVYSSYQLYSYDPVTYVFFTQNAAHGENAGFEGEAHYQASHRVTLSGTLALLRTRYLGYNFDGVNLSGRAQAFAPGYQASVAIEYHLPSGASARLDEQAVDRFFYYTSDNQIAPAHTLTNLRLAYPYKAWTLTLWAHNLLGDHYAQNGFYFGLIPPYFPNQNFYQLADPRQVGLTFSIDLGRAH